HRPRGCQVANGHYFFVVVSVHERRQADLLEVVQTLGLFGLGLGVGERRQEEPGEDGNDRNHDQQLNQRKGASNSMTHLTWLWRRSTAATDSGGSAGAQQMRWLAQA